MEAEEKYIKGFNSGYFITKYEVDLSKILHNNLSCPNEFFEGFFEGKEQFMFENNLEELQHLKTRRKEKDDLEREIN